MRTLSDGIDLGSVTTTIDTDPNVDIGEPVQSDDQERLVDLESEDFWLNKVEWRTIDFDKTTAGLAMGDSGS